VLGHRTYIASLSLMLSLEFELRALHLLGKCSAT
jgi:hypothetical protein